MRKALDNLRGRHSPQGLFLLVPSLALLGILAGVTVPPALSLEHAEKARTQAQERAASRAREARELEAFRAANGFERAREGTRLLREMFPSELTPIEIQSAVRLAAKTSRFELSTFGAGSSVEIEPAGARDRLPDRVMMREVNLLGSGDLTSLVRLVDQLRAAGYPTCVLELGLSRLEPEDETFALRLSLGLFHFAPSPPSLTASEEGAAPTPASEPDREEEL